ncbi:MAG: hypothetical protein KU28_09550 [Sulfurovum sp. PC08-66]|nr:MAG: hypothetical protein KU28_09550 [Sulfurovum sp. PC08-66]
MKMYLFLSTDGYTYDPNDKEINNTQLLGMEKGADAFEAFANFKRSHAYLQQYAFKDIDAIECVGDFIRNFEM